MVKYFDLERILIIELNKDQSSLDLIKEFEEEIVKYKKELLNNEILVVGRFNVSLMKAILHYLIYLYKCKISITLTKEMLLPDVIRNLDNSLFSFDEY